MILTNIHYTPNGCSPKDKAFDICTYLIIGEYEWS